MKIISQIILIILLSISFSCSKDKSYEPLNISYQAKISVNDSSIITGTICYKDIIGYDTSNYTYLVDSNAIKKIKKYFFPNGGLPFTIKITNCQHFIPPNLA